MMRNALMLCIILPLIQSSCSSQATSTASPKDIQHTAKAMAFTLVAQTSEAVPSATIAPTDTPVPSPTLGTVETLPTLTANNIKEIF